MKACLPCPAQAGLGPVGVMDIARTVQEVEDLPCLRYGAEQGIVAASPFLLLVEADGRSLGMTLGGLYRAVEVQGDSGWRQAHQAG